MERVFSPQMILQPFFFRVFAGEREEFQAVWKVDLHGPWDELEGVGDM